MQFSPKSGYHKNLSLCMALLVQQFWICYVFDRSSILSFLLFIVEQRIFMPKMRNCSEMKYSVVFVIVLHLRFHQIFCNIHSMRKEIWPLNLLFNHWNHTFFGFNRKLFLSLFEVKVFYYLVKTKIHGTGYSFWDRLCNYLHKFPWNVLSVHKSW